MSIGGLAVQTDDIWIPPNVGYDEEVRANLTLCVEVTDASSPLGIYAQSDIVLLPNPNATNNFFGLGDWATHRIDGTSMTIVKLEGGAPPLIPGAVTPGDNATRATRASKQRGRGTPKDDPPQGAGLPGGPGWGGSST
jgi:hypothetical protein